MPQPNTKEPSTIEDFIELVRELIESMQQPDTPSVQPQQQRGDDGGMSVNYDSIMEMTGESGASTAGVGAGAAGTEGGIGGVGVPTSGTSAGGAAGGAGASGGSAGSAGGMGGAGIAAIVAAIIAGQHILSKKTSRTFEGQETGDVFSGNFATEPWAAFLGDKFDSPVSAGEKFDAAIGNKDYGQALKRLPAAADYWADPIRTWIGTGTETLGRKLGSEKAGKVAGTILNPIGAILGLLGG